MNGTHPPAELRGQVGGFPVWPPQVRIETAATTPLLDTALDWLAANLRWFDPVHWDRFLPPRQFREGTVLELLVLCRILRRGERHDHPLIDGALELAYTLVSAESFHAALGRGDEKFPYRAYLVALLADLGRPVPTAAERVRTVLTTGCGGWNGTWRTPLSLLELRYVLELGQFPNSLPSTADLLSRTIVTAGPDPLYLRDDEVYALTHVVFYATDFAARSMHIDPELIDTMRTLLGTYLALGDMDLAGELLLSLHAVHPGDCTITAHGWDSLARHRLSEGAVPGPLFDPVRWSGLRAEVAEAYAFGTCHHTTMVAAMAVAERERHHARIP
ncbi:hypothetical protein F3087_24250 [Nocardia colli]|uniref:DUF6895 domain-containing protein n=1 Tax=Nocardia colli TaxID=2545717 RepID=A0A5N0EDQ5_9NOCA|nr:hypothetical protein [Nocardia colli]KAA8886354.1 hypothetical protein F3087_24250 [Nocardia colli]